MKEDSDKEARRTLFKVKELAEENNRLLRKMHRGIIWGRIFKIFYWTIIIGAAVGAYYFIQPYLQPVIDTARGFIPGLQQLDTSTLFQDPALESLQNIQNQ